MDRRFPPGARRGDTGDENLGDQQGRHSVSTARSSASGKVLLTTLWERTSAKGTVYLSGYLGKASVVALRGEPAADGTPTWDVYVSPGQGAGR